MPRSLVTGATGFVGSNLVAYLLQQGWDVACLVRNASRGAPLEQLGAELRMGNLDDEQSLRAAAADAEYVFHVAGRVKALNSAQFHKDNVQGTRHVMQACAAQSQTPTMVLVSSLAAGGPSQPGEPLREADPDRPISAYGQSKLASEKAAAELADEVPLSILRPPIIFGQADRACLAIFRAVRFTRIHAVPGWSGMPVSLVHIAELCDALIRIAQHGTRVTGSKSDPIDTTPATYYVAAERSLSYGELGRLAGRSLGCRSLVVPVPKAGFWLVGGLGELWGQLRRQPAVLNLDKIREAVAPGWECCDEKIRQELGYQPAASLEERFCETATWYREQGWIETIEFGWETPVPCWSWRVLVFHAQ